MKVAFSAGAILLGAFSLTAQAQQSKPKQAPTAKPTVPSLLTPTGSFLGGSNDCATPMAFAGQGSFGFDQTLASTGIEGQVESNCFFGRKSRSFNRAPFRVRYGPRISVRL